MQRLWDQVEKLVVADPLNAKRGWRLSELSDYKVLDYGLGEYYELLESPDAIDEMVDVLGCLIHYAQRKGWTQEQLATAMEKKFVLRFGKGH